MNPALALVCEEVGINWEPVPHPDGELHLAGALARIEARRALQS
ncbi:hypothetical protein [Kitasatospora sp. MBT66]|nr:hypothetical protein [Kitasatospora sp. MBT66]